MVTSSWLRLVTTVSGMVFRRLPSGRYNTRPTYSPMRLGVLTEKETPDNIALYADKNLMGYILLTANFHFQASRPQLANINNITAIKLKARKDWNDSLI